jgi:hypothetical protein
MYARLVPRCPDSPRKLDLSPGGDALSFQGETSEPLREAFAKFFPIV